MLCVDILFLCAVTICHNRIEQYVPIAPDLSCWDCLSFVVCMAGTWYASVKNLHLAMIFNDASLGKYSRWHKAGTTISKPFSWRFLFAKKMVGIFELDFPDLGLVLSH